MNGIEIDLQKQVDDLKKRVNKLRKLVRAIFVYLLITNIIPAIVFILGFFKFFHS